MSGTNVVEQPKPESMLELGAWLGRRQAFGLVANRCTAAEAECLKTMRDRGDHKTLGMSWEEFCRVRAGINRRTADRLIDHLEEFGANYFRLAELMDISPATYRLIAGSVSNQGLEHEGCVIPLQPENREQIVEAVGAVRHRAKSKSAIDPAVFRKRLGALMEHAADLPPYERLLLMGALEAAARKLGSM